MYVLTVVMGVWCVACTANTDSNAVSTASYSSSNSPDPGSKVGNFTGICSGLNVTKRIYLTVYYSTTFRNNYYAIIDGQPEQYEVRKNPNYNSRSGVALPHIMYTHYVEYKHIRYYFSL